MRPIAIFGITGRMGQALLHAVRGGSSFQLSGAVASADSPRLGQDAAAEGTATGVLITSDSVQGIGGASVAVDFSVNTSVAAHARACAAARVPILIGATALSAASRSDLEDAAREIPVLVAPNTSVGVCVVAQLVSVAALGLGPSYDVEIFEACVHPLRHAGIGMAVGEKRAILERFRHAYFPATTYPL